MTKLRVAEAKQEDVFDDIARINENCRFDNSGNQISAGSVCKITIGEESARAIVRGMLLKEGQVIRLDENLRKKLNVKSGDQVDVSLSRSGTWGEMVWCWSASDPSYRITARLAVLSVFLGVVGLLLGGFSLWLTLK